MRNISCRLIEPSEISQLTTLHRAVFPTSQWTRTIYASHKIDAYVASLIEFRNWQNNNFFWGIWHRERLVGYAQFRDIGDSWHLNYVAVDRSYQNRGLGRELFRLWVEEGLRFEHRYFTLDVSQSNVRAVEWYKSYGFRKVSKCWVYEGQLAQCQNSSHPTLDIQLKNWASAEAWQSYYGFSEFTLKLCGEEWPVGRLGSRYFRVTKHPTGILRQVLNKMDSQRKLLILSDCSILDSFSEEVYVMTRMGCDIGSIDRSRLDL